MRDSIALNQSTTYGPRPSVQTPAGGLVLSQVDLLAAAAQEGDLGAFGQIYEAYFDRVARYVFTRVGNWTEAEDLAGEVFLKALQGLAAYTPTGVPFSAWLFRIAHNQVVDHLRRRARRPSQELNEQLPLTDPPPDDQVAQRLTLEAVHRAMEGITEAQRRVIGLRFASELSIAETAQVMGKKEGAIKALQHSAIQAIRKRLRSEGFAFG